MPSQLGADQFVYEVYNGLNQLLIGNAQAGQSLNCQVFESWIPGPSSSSASGDAAASRPPTFYFADIGAADGVELSNTETLERSGWRGVAVDPLLRGFEKRTCACVRAAVYSSSGLPLQFVLAQDPNLSGFADHIQAYRGLIASQKHEVHVVHTRVLEEILQEVQAPPVLHYMSLDTEGSELEILRAFPWASRRLGLLTVEHNFEEPKRSEIRRLMEEKGFVLAKSVAWDDWYVRAEFWNALAAAGAAVVNWQPQPPPPPHAAAV